MQNSEKLENLKDTKNNRLEQKILNENKINFIANLINYKSWIKNIFSLDKYYNYSYKNC